MEVCTYLWFTCFFVGMSLRMLKKSDYANWGRGLLCGSDQFKKEHSIPRQESTNGSRLVGDMNWRNLEESSVCKINSKPIEIYFIKKRKLTKTSFFLWKFFKLLCPGLISATDAFCWTGNGNQYMLAIPNFPKNTNNSEKFVKSHPC